MKQLLFLLTLFMSLNSFSQKTTNLFKPFNLSNSSSLNKTANVLNLKDSSHYSHWYNNAWFFSNKEMYGYNAAEEEHKDVLLYISFGGSVWDTVHRSINYVYNGNHDLLEKVTEAQNGNGDWYSEDKLIQTFDANHNVLTSTTQTSITAGWENVNRQICTYDANNNVLTYLYQSWGSPFWENSYSITATYNANNEYTSNEAKTWNTSSNSWVNYSRLTNMVYSGGDLTSFYTEIWNGSSLTYQPASHTTMTYDGNHHMLTQLSEEWIDFTHSWENDYNNVYTYDANGNETSLTTQTWTMSAWVNAQKEEHYYPTSAGLTELAGKTEAIQLYPNPATGNIDITHTTAFNSVCVTDIKGNVVLTENTKPTNRLIVDVSHLNAGVYFISIKNGDSTAFKKFIKD